MTLRKTLLAAATVLSFSTLAQAGTQQSDKAPPLDKCNKETRLPLEGTVIKGVDGDTVHVKTATGSYSMRMLGIDTQETHFMGKSQGEWAEKAAQTMAELLPAGTPVKIIYGDISCDSHGRPLAHLFKGSMHINAEMVRQGLAVNYCVAPEFRYCDDFSKLTQAAIDAKIGMFSAKEVELPYDFRRRMGNEPQRSYVGDIQSKIVRTPGHQNDTTTANRVFFYTKEDVRAPYHLEE